jgi:hypothetical protein
MYRLMYRYRCPDCDRAFPTDLGLRLHRAKMHKPAVLLPYRFCPAYLESLLARVAIAKEWIADGRISDSEVRQMQDGRDDQAVDTGTGDDDLLGVRIPRRSSRIRQLIQQYSGQSQEAID